MNTIHSTAIVSSEAKLGDNIIISPYAIVEDNVEIGNNCYIGPHAVIYNGARIRNNVKIFQAASVANDPQDLGYAGEETEFIIDDGTTIRECVTLHKGTKSTGFSRVGKNCFLMAYSHVGHDTVVGDNCIFANAVQLAGHVEIEDNVIIGGGTVVHQFCRMGKHTMTGGGYRVTQDMPPFILSAGEPLQYKGLNVIGLRRRGFSNDDISTLKKAYSYLYDKSMNVSQAREKIIPEFGENQYVKDILEFLQKSKRGIIGK
ncbi:MAG: acyl-ACP--UDP-N-acetylglucosamine O-acyltransferase [Ignavibacteriaceae bacterium]